MSRYYQSCSVGSTIFNRTDWAENIDPAFLDMRYEELLDRRSTPRQELRCQDDGENECTRG